jgi:pyruvate dehydrogenase E2 component (dihydrolipoamide acetyltransferase)
VAEFFEMPQASPTMEVGTVLSWKKAEGDALAPQDVLAEVETDKAAMEIEVFDSCFLLKILAEAGDQVPAGQPIAILGESADEDISALLTEFESRKASGPAVASPAATATPTAATVSPVTAPSPPTATGLQPFSWQGKNVDASIMEMPVFTVALPAAAPGAAVIGGKVRSSPAARSAARAKGVNLATVQGTGPRGRVTRADVLRHASGIPASAPSVAAPPPRAIPLPTPNPGDEVIPNNNMRKTIAKRLKAAYSDAPVFFLTTQFDCDALIDFRTALKDAGTKVSYNDIVVSACGHALRDVPEVNAAWAEESIIRRAKVDIGMAVALPGGLITPVIRDADTKSLTDIAADSRALVKKARDGKLAPSEYTGSTFTISNLGMKSIEQFTAIINPPEACILAVGTMQQEPVVRDGELGIGWRMKVTLTCDHRVVDGALGADFLAAIRKYIEDPSKLGS